MGKINAGVTLMQDFCRAESDVFNRYIDYIDREEAQRNTSISKFNLFNDYVGNPYKGSHLFTADKDWLTSKEKQELKDVFTTAQMNESVMWQTVISFDNVWLSKNGVYDSKNKMLDERKICEVTRMAMTELLKREKLENAIWSAGIHYNTDNIHVHIAIVEPYPMRQKMMYEGKLEVRGKFKMSSIKSCKSVVVNELMQTKEINQKINSIIRKDLIEKLKERELSSDPDLQDKFLALCQRLPKQGALNYNNRAVGPIRKQVDEISRMFMDKYCPEKYREFMEIVEHQSLLYAEAYGGENNSVYKEDKEYDLMQRMGNAVLKSAKEYIRQLNGKTEAVQKAEVLFYRRSYGSVDMAEQDMPVQEAVETEIELGNEVESKLEEADFPEKLLQVDMPEPGESEDETVSPFKLHIRETDSQRAGADHPDIKEMEKYFEELSHRGNKNVEPEGSAATGDIYSKYDAWYKEFKMIRDEINRRLRTGRGVPEKTLLDILHQKAETNPFLKAQLGEMYMYGRITDISLERAEEYFEGALDIFEKDVNHIPFKENRFDFESYLQYRIGKQYACGWGTEEDTELAADWFRMSGTSYADYSLANLYYEGKGVEQDFEKAIELYQKAKNNPFANLKLAQIYETGIGTEQNITKSEKYYERAFNQFHAAEEKELNPQFEYQLGNMCYYGKGCEQDIDKGISYLESSAAQANQAAKYLLGKVYLDKESAVYSPEKGLTYIRELAEEGHEYAQLGLGIEYIKGEHTEKDLFQAREWLGKSAEQGNEIAENMLQDMSSSVPQQTMGGMNPMGEFDKALMELRKSLYKAQEETIKNLLIYEKELNEELEQSETIYI